MITFLGCLGLLVAAYFTYGRYLERLCGVDAARPVPSATSFDGVDYIPMPMWRTFLIQLLNIAGLGPIFGAVLGAAYGPVAFLWITFGGIFMGAAHDFIAGIVSLRSNGASLPETVGTYLGPGVKQLMRVFSVGLMVLVGAVFLSQPASADRQPHRRPGAVGYRLRRVLVVAAHHSGRYPRSIISWRRCCPWTRSSAVSIRFSAAHCFSWRWESSPVLAFQRQIYDPRVHLPGKFASPTRSGFRSCRCSLRPSPAALFRASMRPSRR